MEREREKGSGKIHLPLHSYMRVPEWNSLCWLVESEIQEKESCPFEERKQELLRFMEHSFSYLENLNTGRSL
jgi:hypothetical protein